MEFVAASWIALTMEYRTYTKDAIASPTKCLSASKENVVVEEDDPNYELLYFPQPLLELYDLYQSIVSVVFSIDLDEPEVRHSSLSTGSVSLKFHSFQNIQNLRGFLLLTKYFCRMLIII